MGAAAFRSLKFNRNLAKESIGYTLRAGHLRLSSILIWKLSQH